MQGSDPLSKALEEVESVASELRRLKDRANEFAAASQNLKDVTSVLGDVAKSVGRVRDLLEMLVQKAESSDKRFEETRKSTEALIGSLPGIIDRIEKSEASTALAEVRSQLTSMRKEMADFRADLLSRIAVLESKSECQSAIINQGFTDCQIINKAFCTQLEKFREEILADISKMATKEDIELIKGTLAENSTALETISKRRGFLF